MARTPPTLGTRIRRARERARLSQEELAALVGASVRAVGDWENDRRKPRNRLGALEEALGVRLDDDQPPEPEIPRDILDAIRREVDPSDQQRVIDAVAATLRGGNPTLPPAPSKARHERRAG